jgi:hypothetical protein
LPLVVRRERTAGFMWASREVGAGKIQSFSRSRLCRSRSSSIRRKMSPRENVVKRLPSHRSPCDATLLCVSWKDWQLEVNAQSRSRFERFFNRFNDFWIQYPPHLPALQNLQASSAGNRPDWLERTCLVLIKLSKPSLVAGVTMSTTLARSLLSRLG